MYYKRIGNYIQKYTLLGFIINLELIGVSIYCNNYLKYSI